MSIVNTKTHTDIKRLAWIESILPQAMRPYAYLMRLDRPVGIWLLLLPGLWGISLASGGLPGLTAHSLWQSTLFLVGAFIMRGAGCVINDIWDRNLDKQVERTRERPLASGTTSVRQAIVFLATLLLLGLVILCQFNQITIILGVLSLPLIIVYPLMKRITWWPQAFLGLTFNFGALMGWSATTGTLAPPAILLYAGGIFWTLGYDTIYAHQDKEDDVLAGIKSTALRFGKHSKKWVGAFYTLATLCFSTALLFTSHHNTVVMLALLPALHFIWQLNTWNPDDQSSSLTVFKSNTRAGLLILIATIL